MTMSMDTTATFKKSARIVSDYENDMIFEQPRDGLLKQEFKSIEQDTDGNIRVVTITRTYTSGDYQDVSKVEILPIK